MKKIYSVCMALWLLICPAVPAAGAGPAPPHIVILATGGTIAGAASTATETKDYRAGVMNIDRLLGSVPGIGRQARITGEQVVNIDSSLMTDEIWLKLANRVNRLLASPEVDGVVITHGTDTLEETAFFLNLAVKSEKPVVLVGAMRPATAVSADGPLNLLNAVTLAASREAKGRGVLVTLNEKIHSGREVTKTNTTGVDTFSAREFGCLGYILDNQVFFFQESLRRHTGNSEFDLQGLATLPRVDILYGYANEGRELADAAVKSGARGIVHAGMGNGGMSAAMKAALRDAAAKGVVIVRASRTGSGLVTPQGEYDRLGFLVAGSLNPQKARILLMLALTGTGNLKNIQRIFNEY